MYKVKRVQKGLTFIEMSISLCILSILLSISVNTFNGLFEREELKNKIEEIYYFLKLAQSNAITQNKKIYVHFCNKRNTNEWRMGMTDLNFCDCFIENSCTFNGHEYVKSVANGSSLFVKKISFKNLSISYGQLRFHTNLGSITLISKNNISLRVNQGKLRLRICSPKKNRLGYPKC